MRALGSLAVSLFLSSSSAFRLSVSSLPSPVSSQETKRAQGSQPRSCLSMSGTLKNDLMLRAARGETVERTPVWLFRQAGRHLPEYNEYKKQKGKNFLQLLNDPEDVAEVTLQPIRRYDVDAAILFSDILVVLQAFGFDVEMPGGRGITVPSPLADVEDFRRRFPSSDEVDVQMKLGHVLESVSLIKERLEGQVPLIGFSGAPWTLMFYLVGGSSKQNTDRGRQWLERHPEESRKIINGLTDVVIEYLSAQVERGADMLQVFEAMGDFLSPSQFEEFALPSLERIARELKKRHPQVPLLVFPRGACYAIATLQECGYDVVTLDTATDRMSARADLSRAARESGLGKPARVQGNFPVGLLQRRDGVSLEEDIERVRAEAERMLEQLGTQGLIANLGEGLTGKESPALVESLVNSLHSASEKMIGSSLAVPLQAK